MKPNANRLQQYVEKVRHRSRMAFYNLGYRLIGSLDGYPLPPASLVDLVIGTREVAWYQLGGLFMHQSITSLLRRKGIVVEQLKSIYDFGCGCGRIIRWWAALKDISDIRGTDYNPALVAWCQKNLSSFAKFSVNNPEPPLDFPDGYFELVYSYSVLTHLRKDIQEPWIVELIRILKPGGYLLLTTHGPRVGWRLGFSGELLDQLEQEGLVVFNEDQTGSNQCAAFHSERFMVDLQRLGLELLESLPGGVRDSSEQDMYLYRKL